MDHIDYREYIDYMNYTDYMDLQKMAIWIIIDYMDHNEII